MPIPRHLRLLFWDTNLDELDPTVYPVYAIERVLEYGNEEAVAWFDQKYTKAPFNRVHLLKALTYFIDAECEPMPHMRMPLAWDTITQFFLETSGYAVSPVRERPGFVQATVSRDHDHLLIGGRTTPPFASSLSSSTRNSG